MPDRLNRENSKILVQYFHFILVISRQENLQQKQETFYRQETSNRKQEIPSTENKKPPTKTMQLSWADMWVNMCKILNPR